MPGPGTAPSRTPRPERDTLLALVRVHARIRPSSIAFVGPGFEPVDYATLDAGLRATGEALARLGLVPGRRVAIALADRRAAAFALLAVAAHGIAVPLDAALGIDEARVRLLATRSEALLLGAGDGGPLAAAARAASVDIVRVHDFSPGGGAWFDLRLEAGARDPRRAAEPAPDDVAIVALTSGTTGTPRAVPLQQRALASAPAAGLGPHDRALTAAPMHTTSALGVAILMPLAAGASAILLPGFDPESFADAVERWRPTFYSASPTAHEAIVDALARRDVRARASLRFVRSSSDGLDAARQARLEARLGVPVIQGYGSTETGLVAQDAPGDRRAGSVGRPVDGMTVMIVEDDVPLPPERVGEIVVRAPTLAAGYENDAEAARASFRDGAYRTGDLGRFDADGFLYVVGRVRERIHRGGLKIAPAEVDAAFAGHPAIAEVATVGLPHPTWGEDVVTAFVPRAGVETPDEDALRAWVRERLSPHCVPGRVLAVDAIPRNAQGKIERLALAASLRLRVGAPYVAPRDADEALVASTCAEVLGLDRAGALDHFFDLGGDSLSAARVLARLRQRAGVDLAASALFESPTIEKLAAALRQARARDASSPALVRRSRAPVPPSLRRSDGDERS